MIVGHHSAHQRRAGSFAIDGPGQRLDQGDVLVRRQQVSKKDVRFVPDFQGTPGAAPPPRDFTPRGRCADQIVRILADRAAPRRRRMEHFQHGDLLPRMQLPDGFVAAAAVPVESFAHRLDLAPTQPLARHGDPAAMQDADQPRSQVGVPHQPGQGAVDAEERVGRLGGRRQSHHPNRVGTPDSSSS